MNKKDSRELFELAKSMTDRQLILALFVFEMGLMPLDIDGQKVIGMLKESIIEEVE